MTRRAAVRSTTVLAVIRDGAIAMASDGQVTVGETMMKRGAQKVRRAAKGDALIGFAGGAADALALTERLEAKLEAHPGNVRRACVELAAVRLALGRHGRLREHRLVHVHDDLEAVATRSRFDFFGARGEKGFGEQP